MMAALMFAKCDSDDEQGDCHHDKVTVSGHESDEEYESFTF